MAELQNVDFIWFGSALLETVGLQHWQGRLTSQPRGADL